MLTDNKVVLNQECNNNKNETTPLLLKEGLLKPSANSTDNPSWSNLADCDSESEISLTTSLSHHHDHDDCEGKMISEYGTTTLTTRRRRIRQRHVALVVLAGIVGFFSLRHFVFGPASSSHDKQTSRDPSNKTYKNPIIIVAFSQLDPVQDLGLTNFQRPSNSRPPPGLESFILKKKQQKQQQTSQQQKSANNTTANTVNVAIPTNAWYQNLLSVDNDDIPSTIHRAYTIPYIVDAAGPIAGLRIHPNHILATQTVIQLNVVEQHGLTVGAAAASATTTIVSESRSQKQKHDDVMNTRFHVENMTPLAITLGWVSISLRLSLCLAAWPQ